MSDPKPERTVKPPRAYGWMAEYEDENQLLEAARQVRDSGYTRTDAFSPFPIHGIEDALGIKPTVLPWFTLAAGAAGTLTALTMQWWMNAIDYPYIISGKPFASWPAFIPVTFELTVLFAAFTTVFAMLGLNGLPRFSNPVFNNPKFDRSTDDRFFLWVDSSDKYFNSEKVKSLLGATSPLAVEEVIEDETSAEIPRPLITIILTFILITLIPGAIVLNIRAAKSKNPRLHVFFDMDFQPKKDSQATTTIFTDNRVARQPVPGTIARGDLELADPYYLGYDPEQTAALDGSGAPRLVGFQQTDAVQQLGDATRPDEGQSPVPAAREPAVEELPAGEAPAAGSDAAASPAPLPTNHSDAATNDSGAVAISGGEPNYAWLSEFPLPVTAELFELGKAEYEQNCAVCHGFSGYGNGLVAQRAAALAQGYWVQPTSLHEPRIQEQPVGRIYYTIANGKGKMGSYAPSLSPKERWAVVLYVRALQRSQNAADSDIPAGATVVKAESPTPSTE